MTAIPPPPELLAVAALLGVAFHNQAWVPDPPANAFAAVLSNAGTGSIGR